jgi:hypothetical protein
MGTIRTAVYPEKVFGDGSVPGHLSQLLQTLKTIDLTPDPFALITLLGLLVTSSVLAGGDVNAGKEVWIKVCAKCHGDPQPRSSDAFSDYDTTANRLSVYASDPVAITKAATEGYTIPVGNTNDKADPGKSTKEPMGEWVGVAPNRLGVGTTPTQLAINISAYLASFFAVPAAPTIINVTAGNGKATVSFNVPKSDLTITSYTVVANPGGVSASGAASPVTVAGLANGTAYTFQVKATSNAGTSPASPASNPVTPVAK